SSTIIGLKLLPATELHHQHAGEVIIAVLLLQDVIAIVIMLGLQGFGPRRLEPADVAWVLAALPLLIAGAFVIERFLVRYLLARFDTIQEYVFLVAVGWCLGLAQVAEALHLSYEIGAFVAGVALATSPISRFIAESLRPLRDFFLIMFFFALGAGLELEMLGSVLVPGLLLATAVLLIKPAVFRTLLRWEGERGHLALEVGVRLGQMSEFSLLIAVVALETGVIGARASYLIQLATVLSFMLSSYAIGIRYPTPIAASERLRRD
ncbi:MAG: cation:proton antiporter, partial [Gammaproteobacteria bacterium]|nr:cation:proton antiporter [Gammaproteobacteria bacterium]